jgi:hypothetical protein
MSPGRPNEPESHRWIAAGESPRGSTAEATADCRTCDMRSACITWGWRSPRGLWFENAVILQPKPGCRGFVGRGAEIRAHFTDLDRSKIPDREH